MEKLYELHEETDFDLVVVDTPPTRHALDFLDAPRRLTRFLDHRLFRMLMAPSRGIVRAVNVGRPGVPADGVQGGRRRRDRRRHRLLPGLRGHGGGLPAASGPGQRAAGGAGDRLRAGGVAAAGHGRGGAVLRRPAGGGRHRRAGARGEPHAPRSATAWARRPPSGPHPGRHRARRALPQPGRLPARSSARSAHLGAGSPTPWRRRRSCGFRSSAPTCTTSTAWAGWPPTCSRSDPVIRRASSMEAAGSSRAAAAVSTVSVTGTMRSKPVVWSRRVRVGRLQATATSPPASGPGGCRRSGHRGRPSP